MRRKLKQFFMQTERGFEKQCFVRTFTLWIHLQTENEEPHRRVSQLKSSERKSSVRKKTKYGDITAETARKTAKTFLKAFEMYLCQLWNCPFT